MFFHGTSTKWQSSFQENGIRIRKLNKKKDFGQGFYLTSHYWQAKLYADKIATFTKSNPLIISCVIPLGALRSFGEQGLLIDDFNEDWLSIITRGRFFEVENPLSKNYHWIYGRCGDGATDQFEKGFQAGLDLKSLLPHIIPNNRFPHYEYDQLWLGTNEAINRCIKSVAFMNMEGVGNGERIPLHK